MRIAMISYHTCPLATLGGKDTGGMNVYVRDLTRELGRRGVGVDVFTRSQDEHQPHVKHDLGHGNRVVHVPAGPEIPLPRSVLYEYLPEFVEGIQSFATENSAHYDLIHSHYWLSGSAAWKLQSSNGRLPIVHMFHTLGLMKTRAARRQADEEDTLRIQSEMEILEIADRIVVATPAECSQLQWLYDANMKKVVIIPPGVDLDLFYHIPRKEARALIGVQPEHRMLLFVGRIEPLKGLDTLLRAMAMVKQKGLPGTEQLCLAVIGGDPSESPEEENAEMVRLQELRESLGIEDIVTFLGKRDQDSLRNYYAAAEAVVMPSHYESFGMVALEAMASGTPVVASEVGGLAFLVQDGVTGFHVPERDPEGLYRRLAALLTDDELRKRLGRQAAEYARGYAWPNIAEQIIELYERVIP